MNEQQQQSATDSGVTEYFEGYQQLELEAVENNLRKTRNAIFVVAGLAALGGIIMYSSGNIGVEDLWLNLILTVAYAVLAFLTNKIPMTAVIIAIVLFVGTWILNIVVGGAEQIMRGILIKGIILFYLIKGIGYAREAEELRKRIHSDRQ